MSAKSTGAALGGVVMLVVVAVAAYGIWLWGFCRFYVPPAHMAIVTAKSGEPLKPEQILAGPGQKGVQAEPLAEGRHFRNPVFYDWEIVPMVRIPAGRIGVVTAKVGDKLPPGEFLAGKGQKGIWRDVLGPGRYRLNPVGYKVDVLDAITVPIGYVGVVTSLSGTMAPAGEFAADHQKGIRADILQPGLYYINPKQFKIDVLEMGLNQVSLTGEKGGQVLTKGQLTSQNVAMSELASNVLEMQQRKRRDYLQKQQMQQGAPAPRAADRRRKQTQKQQEKIFVRDDSIATLGLTQFVEFPSKDGFEVRLDMTVEFELLPGRIARIFRSFGDLPAVVDKIIMPQILSVSRLKGSSYGAKDFIVGEGREKFQNDLKQELARILGEKDIVIHNALIRHVSVPQEILAPIQATGVAIEQNLTNKERQNTERKRADLNREQNLIEQRRQEVMQDTEKLKAEIQAEKEREVASIAAEADREVAEIARETARVRADITRRIGEAEAKVVELVEGEKAAGFKLKVKAMQSADAYTMQEFAEQLNPRMRLRIIHAGEGTMWTDLKNATFGDLGGARILRGK